MAQTINDIIERVYRRYLTPMFDQPVASTLNANISDTATTVVVSAFRAIEYNDALSRGTIIEVGEELMRVDSASETVSDANPITCTVTRGVFGTTAVAHTAGDQVVVAPQFPRYDVFLAVADEVENLYPDLWAVSDERWDSPPYTLPDDFSDIIECYVQNSAGELLPHHYAYVTYIAGEPVLAIGGTTPYPVHVTYAAKPIRPIKTTQTLVQLNLQDRWADIIAMGAAIQHLTGQNISDLRADYLTDLNEISVTEGVSPSNIENQLRRARAIRLNEERRRLRTSHRVWTQQRNAAGI